MGKVKKTRIKNSSKSYSKRNRSRKSKSKKPLRHDDSASHTEESDSLDSRCISSSSSSEDDYTTRKSKSRRGSSRKKTRRSSKGSDSSEDLLYVRKRKRSRKSAYKGKKKKRLNKRKRDKSMSSATSSEPCSTCRCSSSVDDEEDYGRRDKSERRGRDERNKKSRVRSGSFSSCSRAEACDETQHEEFGGKSTARRLKSVITVVNDNWNDENEEMISTHDDYPLRRSTESIEKGSPEDVKRDPVASDTKRQAYTDRSHSGEERMHKKQRLSENVDLEESNQDFVESDDLESVLRKRALENLKRFQEGSKDSKVSLKQEDGTANDHDLEAQVWGSELLKGNFVEGDDSTKFSASSSTVSHSGKKVEEVGGDDGSTKFGLSGTQPGNQRVDPTKSAYSGQSKLIRSVWRRNASVASTESAARTYSGENLGGGESDNDAVKHAPIATNDRDVHEGNTGNDSKSEVRSSPPKPVLAKEGSGKPQEEGKKGEFEQKKMSVMRGGEMVQVSYKVYIPQKTPALARRQLKR